MPVPVIGAHLPISKGLKATADDAVLKGAEAVQIFLRNPRGRGARNFTEDEVAYFKNKLQEHGISPIVVHIPYICNPASVKEDLYSFAKQVIEEDLSRCDMVGADYLVLHPGAYTGATLEEGIKRVARLLDGVLQNYQGNTMLLLETMSGQGTEIGKSFAELKAIIDKMEMGNRVGICYDTCHTYAAGYDCTTEEGIKSILAEIDAAFGQERVKLVHANDSMKGLGEKRDRHAHIGEGFIGEPGFSLLLHDNFFRKLPFILETPYERIEEDLIKLKTWR